jgi:hypothetical protein
LFERICSSFCYGFLFQGEEIFYFAKKAEFSLKGGWGTNIKKVESEGSPKFEPFFQSWNKRAIPKWLPNGTKLTYDVLANDQKTRKKGKVVTTGIEVEGIL